MNCKDLLETNKFLLPPVFFTDRKKISDFQNTINNLAKNAIIIIREYDLDLKSREEFAKKIAKYAKARNLRFLVGKDFNLAKKIGANGVHFSDFDIIPIKFFNKNSFAKDFIFSLSCHSERSFLKLGKAFQPDLIFISPIFPTTSHKESQSLGLRFFLKLSLKTKKLGYNNSIFALGGINSTNIKSIRKLKKFGFGAIDFLKN